MRRRTLPPPLPKIKPGPYHRAVALQIAHERLVEAAAEETKADNMKQAQAFKDLSKQLERRATMWLAFDRKNKQTNKIS